MSAIGEFLWGLWKDLRRAIDVTPAENDEAEAIRWEALSDIEIKIHADQTASPRAAERKLWIGLSHTLTSPESEGAIYRKDFAWFQRKDRSLDWNERMFVAAIATLRCAQGRA